MMIEIRRQLDAARKAGLDIRYLDEHIFVSRVCGLREPLAEFARSEGLIDADPIPMLPPCGAPGVKESPAAAWIKRILASSPEAHVLISHVGFDRDDLRRCQLVGQPEGLVAAERDAERQAWHDPRLREVIESAFVALLRYDQVAGLSIQ
jgi:hypothetical protein